MKYDKLVPLYYDNGNPIFSLDMVTSTLDFTGTKMFGDKEVYFIDGMSVNKKYYLLKQFGYNGI